MELNVRPRQGLAGITTRLYSSLCACSRTAQVKEYEGLKRPKHHFAAHLAIDAWKYGPPRGYWTMGFEAFNKVIKAGGRSSNMKHESMSIMQHWSMWSAWQMTISEEDLRFWKL